MVEDKKGHILVRTNMSRFFFLHCTKVGDIVPSIPHLNKKLFDCQQTIQTSLNEMVYLWKNAELLSRLLDSIFKYLENLWYYKVASILNRIIMSKTNSKSPHACHDSPFLSLVYFCVHKLILCVIMRIFNTWVTIIKSTNIKNSAWKYREN